MDFLTNFPFWSAIAAIFFAQFVKVPIQYLATRKLNWSLLTSNGGMPSSHSAAVTALTTGVAIEAGIGFSHFRSIRIICHYYDV